MGPSDSEAASGSMSVHRSLNNDQDIKTVPWVPILLTIEYSPKTFSFSQDQVYSIAQLSPLDTDDQPQKKPSLAPNWALGTLLQISTGSE